MGTFRINSILCCFLLASCGGEAMSGPDGTPDQDAGVDAAKEAGLEASNGEAADGNASDGDASDGTAVCSHVAKLECEVPFRCVPIFASGVFEDEDSCVAQKEAACELALASPAVTFTGSELLACATEKNGASCEDYLLNRLYDTPHFGACDLPAGETADGGACVWDAECASEHCTMGGQPGCGTCEPAVPQGDVCNGVQCAPDERCWSPPGSGQMMTCVEAAGFGESCDDTKPCWDGAKCENGVCAAPAFGKEGAPCEPEPLYPFFWNSACYPGDYQCDADTNTCVPLPTPGAIGESCEPTLRLCAAGGYCKSAVCVPTVPWGSPCYQQDCTDPAVCREGICQFPSTDQCD